MDTTNGPDTEKRLLEANNLDDREKRALQEEEEHKEERGHWTGRMDFLLACIGMCQN